MTKRVLITGSSRGIGKQTALYLAQNGYEVVLHCSKDIKKLDEVELESGKSVKKLVFDVKDREKAREILTKDVEENGIYYGVVLNAGINADVPFAGMEDFEWDNVINTNLNGFYNVLKPLIMPLIQKREGRIVVMSSIAALTGNKGQINYSASKAALIGAVKTLSREIAKRHITVNCIAPGIIETDMTRDVPEDVIKQIPLKRMGTGKEVASLVNYLLSEDASYITGQVISVNGGLY